MPKFTKGIVVGPLLLAMLATLAPQSLGHGRMMEPPNRSSLWRRPEFDHYDPPKNYNDNELFCGGVDIQYGVNDGKCGPCGDPFNATIPRDNEHGGFYGRGVISKQYMAGQTINIIVELTFGHLGHFEFRICNLDTPTLSEDEECFDQNLLELVNGSPADRTKFPIPSSGHGWYRIDALLPQGLSCDHCVLQWHYRAGNNWGECDDGSWGVGCGPQETFRGCSDIAIV